MPRYRLRTLLILLGAIVVIGLWVRRSTRTGPRFSREYTETVVKGGRLSATEVRVLEGHLTQNPEELEVREQLLVFYFLNRRAYPSRQTEHVVWFIRNAPESEVFGHFGELVPFFNPDGYAEAKEAWLQELEAEPNNQVLLKGAFRLLRWGDSELAARLLERGQRLDPSDPEWARRLARKQWSNARLSADAWDPEEAAQAFAAFERAYALSGTRDRGYLLKDLAMAAFVTGDLQKASQYAEQALEDLPRPWDSDRWDRGNRVHIGNLVLGRVALAEGDLDEAGARLIAAGETPGSPQLTSFGADMALARALLERGRTQSVLRYLELCRKFWESGQHELDDWIAEIEAGRIPDFGDRLEF